MRKEVVKLLNERCERIMEHAKPNELQYGMSGSMMRFEMAMGLIGYPLDPSDMPDWFKKNHLEAALTEEEYDSGEYDKLIEDLFYKTSRHVNRKNKKR